MHYALKVALCVLTCAGAFFFACREMKLKNELTEGFSTHKGVADWEVLTDLSEQVKRQRFLDELPPEAHQELRVLVGLKFFFFASLVLELALLLR